MDTMTIKPVKAAIGIFSMTGAPNMMNTNSITEAKIPDSLALAPEEILINDCPIMAQPPIPEKIPERKLAIP